MTTISDWQLIEAYVRERSESAFRSLVERYARIVHASAFRQTGDSHMAEEIAQAVFTLLARKADSFQRSTVLVGWLFQTTRFVASRALRSEQRRRRREKEALEMQELNAKDETWRQVLPVIDEALSRLGETDRNAILLRYLDDRSLREIGESLGMTEEAARKRLTRAVEKLRRVLGRRGVTASVATITGVLGSQLPAAADGTMVASLSANSLAPAGGSMAGSMLVSQTLAAERWVRLAWAAGATAVVAVVLFLFIRMGRDIQSAAAVATRQSETAQATQFDGVVEAWYFDLNGKPAAGRSKRKGQFSVFVKDQIWRTSWRAEQPADPAFPDFRQTMESGGDGTNVYRYVAPAAGTSIFANKFEHYTNHGWVYRAGNWHPSGGEDMAVWLAFAGNCSLHESTGSLRIDLGAPDASFSYERFDDTNRNAFGPAKVRIFASFATNPEIRPVLVRELEVLESRRERGLAIPALVELRFIHQRINGPIVGTQSVFRVSGVVLKETLPSAVWIKPSARTLITDLRLGGAVEYIASQWLTPPAASHLLESGKAERAGFYRDW